MLRKRQWITDCRRRPTVSCRLTLKKRDESRAEQRFSIPSFSALPTEYEGGLPRCLASAPRQSPCLGRAVGGWPARCRNDFAVRLPPDGRSFRASVLIGAWALKTHHIRSRNQQPDVGQLRPGPRCVSSCLKAWRLARARHK